jgi:hypothetical protein
MGQTSLQGKYMRIYYTCSRVVATIRDLRSVILQELTSNQFPHLNSATQNPTPITDLSSKEPSSSCCLVSSPCVVAHTLLLLTAVISVVHTEMETPPPHRPWVRVRNPHFDPPPRRHRHPERNAHPTHILHSLYAIPLLRRCEDSDTTQRTRAMSAHPCRQTALPEDVAAIHNRYSALGTIGNRWWDSSRGVVADAAFLCWA